MLAGKEIVTNNIHTLTHIQSCQYAFVSKNVIQIYSTSQPVAVVTLHRLSKAKVKLVFYRSMALVGILSSIEFSHLLNSEVFTLH